MDLMLEAGSVRAWVLAFVLAAGIGFGGLIGIGCAVGANACPFSKEEPFLATDGETIWLAKCAACHGRDGVDGRAPSVRTGPLASLTAAELRARIARGRPLAGMPRFRRELTPQQIAAVADYVVSLRRSP